MLNRAARRREDQLTRELERQYEIITKTVDVEAIAVAAGQDVSDGENPLKQPKSPERFVMSPNRSEKLMNDDHDIVLQPGPGRDHGDAIFQSPVPVSSRSPAMSDDLDLESCPRARTESRVPLAARELAQIRRRDTSSP